MRLVLNVPMPPHQVQHTPGCRPLGVQTGDPIDHFSPFLPRLLDDDVTPHLKDLRQTGPITVTHQLSIRSINSPYSEFQAAGKDWSLTPTVVECPSAALTGVSADAGFPLRWHAR